MSKVFSHTATVQTYTVVGDGVYTITGYAPKGGRGTCNKSGQRENGGYGATVTGTFKLKDGDVLKVIVGSAGGDASSASFTWANDKQERGQDRTSGGAGGICGVFLMGRGQGLPLLIASGGKGGRDLCYYSTNTVNKSPSTPTYCTTKIPSVFHPHEAKYTNYDSKDTYSRGGSTVHSGWGIDDVSMDDTCAYAGIHNNNFVHSGGTVSANSTFTNTGKVEITKQSSEDVPVPDLSLGIKVTSLPNISKDSSKGHVIARYDHLKFTVPSWVSKAFFEIVIVNKKTGKEYTNTYIRDESQWASTTQALTDVPYDTIIPEDLLYRVSAIYTGDLGTFKTAIKSTAKPTLPTPPSEASIPVELVIDRTGRATWKPTTLPSQPIGVELDDNKVYYKVELVKD